MAQKFVAALVAAVHVSQLFYEALGDGCHARESTGDCQINDDVADAGVSLLQSSVLVKPFVVADSSGAALIGTDRSTTKGDRDVFWPFTKKKEAPKLARYRQIMENNANVVYVANVTIGSQIFRSVLDTGSFELLVLSHQCKACGNVAVKYDHNKSTSFHQGSLISRHVFGSGETTSLEAWDNVAVGPLDAKNQSFWEVIKTDMSKLFADASFQAIVGLGPPEAPALGAWTEAEMMDDEVDRLQKQGLDNRSEEHIRNLEAIVNESYDIAMHASTKSTLLDTLKVDRFSICLGSGEGKPGYLVWNDDDPKKRLDMFIAVPVAASHTWGVHMTNFALGKNGHTDEDNSVGCEKGCGAIVDSGTSLLVLPSAVFKSTQAALAKFGTDCDNIHKFPPLNFDLGGQQFSLPADKYLAKVRGLVPNLSHQESHSGGSPVHAACELELLAAAGDMDSQLGPLVILGLPFLRHYYTTFELGSDKNTDRVMYMAHVDNQCQPAKAKVASLLDVRQEALSIDKSKARLPHWVGTGGLGRSVNI